MTCGQNEVLSMVRLDRREGEKKVALGVGDIKALG
jgi:hypothetical protein